MKNVESDRIMYSPNSILSILVFENFLRSEYALYWPTL